MAEPLVIPLQELGAREGDDTAEEILRRLRAEPLPTTRPRTTDIPVGPGVPFTASERQLIQERLGVTPEEAMAPLPGTSDPQQQFLDPQELMFRLRQEPTADVLMGQTPLALEAEARGIPARSMAARRLEEAIMRGLAQRDPEVRFLGSQAAMLAAGGISGAGTGIGGTVAARVLNRFFPQARRAVGLGRVSGASAGAALASEFNQALGLEADTAFNTVTAAAFPIVGAGASRLIRTVMGATGAGRTVRAMQAGEILEQTPFRIITPALEQQYGPMLVQQMGNTMGLRGTQRALFDIVRTPGQVFDMRPLIRRYGTFNERQRQQIVRAVRNARPELGPRMESMLGVTPGRTRALVPTGTQNVVSGDELATIREGLSDTLFGIRQRAAREAGRSQAALNREARELQRAIDAFDEVTTQVPLGQTLNSGVRLTELMKTADELGDYVNSISRPRFQGRFQGKEFNIERLIDDVNDARRLFVANRLEVGHPLFGVAKQFQNDQAFALWRADMNRLLRLSPSNNIQLFSQTFGPVTRGIAVGGELIGARAIGEIGRAHV